MQILLLLPACTREHMAGFPDGAAGSTSEYQTVIPLDKALEATCLGQVLEQPAV